MTWDRDSYDNEYNAGYQVGFKSGYEAGAKDVTTCECGFSRDACAANPCLRKKAHLAGLTPGSRWPEGAPISQDSKTTGDGTRNGRTTQPELTGSPCGTPQGAGGFIAPADRWVVGKNGWDAADEETREDI